MRRWRGLRLLPLLLLVLALVGASCAPLRPAVAPAPASEGYAHPELLAETDWLAQHLEDPALRIVDMRPRDQYQAGHIPGAVHLDGARLKDDANRLYVIPPDKFERLMSELGIGNDTTVVAYDADGGLWAARLWWVLDYYGHTRAKVLNGGWVKWIRENRPTTTAEPKVAPATFTARPNPAVICTLDEVKAAIDRPNAVIIDARSPAEYSGTDVRAKRGGHIPSAVNIDWRQNITEDLKVFKPAAELRRLYESKGITKDKEIITYCQTAVRAAHTFFTLRLIGYGQIRNYDGSWAEWGNREDTPIQR